MELSLFLAKLMGCYFLGLAAIAFFRKEQFQKNISDIMNSSSVFALSGIMALLFGIAVVIAHPVWELSWRGMVSLVGVIAIVQGVVRLSFTDMLIKKFSQFNLEHVYWIMITVMTLLGVYLAYHGFH